MSWDATLVDDATGEELLDVNYTHNCNVMANIALGYDVLPVTWWKQLDGLSGPEGGALLDRIIRGLEADPDRFRAMNPSNGWGDYDSFLTLLRTMRAAVPEWPTTWWVSG